MNAVNTIPKSWHKRTLDRAGEYVITHQRSREGQQHILVELATNEARFQHARYFALGRPPYADQFTVVGRTSLAAGLTIADAAAQLTAAIPAEYRDLKVSMEIGEQYHFTRE